MCERAATGRRQARNPVSARDSRSTPGPHSSRCRRSSASCSTATGDPLDVRARRCAGRADRALPVRRRHRARLLAPTSRPSATTSTTLWARAAGDDWRRFMRRAERIWDATHEPFLESPLNGIRSLVRQAWQVGDLAAIAPWQQPAIAGPAVPPRPAAADVPRPVRDLHAAPIRARHRPRSRSSRTSSRRSVRGTWTAACTCWARRSPTGLSNAARASCSAPRSTSISVTRRHGVERRASSPTAPGCPPTSWSPTPTPAIGLRRVAAGRKARCPARVLPVRRRRCRGSSSCSGFAAVPQASRHHTVLFPEDYDAEFDAVFGGRVAEDPTVYVSAPRDLAVAPQVTRRGSSSSTPRGTGRSTGTPKGPAYAEPVVELLAERGLDIRDRIVVREVRSPADLERLTGSPRRVDLRQLVQRSDGSVPPAGQRSRSTACSWSVARHTPAAGCRWSRCRRRSSPASSARASQPAPGPDLDGYEAIRSPRLCRRPAQSDKCCNSNPSRPRASLTSSMSSQSHGLRPTACHAK